MISFPYSLSIFTRFLPPLARHTQVFDLEGKEKSLPLVLGPVFYLFPSKYLKHVVYDFCLLSLP